MAEGIVDFGDRTITVFDTHPLYAAFLESWPHCGWLHRHQDLGGVDMQVRDGSLVYTAGQTGGPDGILDYFDTLMGVARSWKESYDFVEQELHLDGMTATLCRTHKSRMVAEHYESAELQLVTGRCVSSLGSFSVDELRRLGQFLVDYAESMEDDTRDDLAEAQEVRIPE